MTNPARRKQYVEVVATHYIDGSVRPQKIVLATGPVYEIEDSREAAPGKAHTTGELARRYVEKIKGKETYLYEAGGRWYVEMKAKMDYSWQSGYTVFQRGRKLCVEDIRFTRESRRRRSGKSLT